MNGWHWWDSKKEDKIFVIGLDERGNVWYRWQTSDGAISENFRGRYVAGQLIPIPECTGWDWKPKELPKVGETWVDNPDSGYTPEVLTIKYCDEDYVLAAYFDGTPGSWRTSTFTERFMKNDD